MGRWTESHFGEQGLGKTFWDRNSLDALGRFPVGKAFPVWFHVRRRSQKSRTWVEADEICRFSFLDDCLRRVMQQQKCCAEGGSPYRRRGLSCYTSRPSTTWANERRRG